MGIRLSTNLAHPAPPPSRGIRALSAPRRVRVQETAAGIIAASYSRFSSDQQDASSIEQQQRKCREAAGGTGHDLRAEFEFADHAVSGTRADRAGLQAMLAAARQRRFHVVYFESLSRLAREMIISQAVLKELVYVHHIRVISTSEGVDSERDGWEFMATFRSWMHAEFLKQLRETVLRGQEHAVLSGFSVGQWCFGYASDPIPGSEVGRGRHAKPRMRIVVREEHARWVRQVFAWFVVERRSVAWIARELTRQNAPKDHRATTPEWRPAYVVRLLRNRKYVGLWPWGEKTNVRNPLTGQVCQKMVEDAAQFTREYPDLRLVPDEQFLLAQGRLDHQIEVLKQRRRADGRLRGSTVDAQNPRHLLQGLVKCAACGSTFQVGGAGGKYLKCAGYQAGACQVKTQLRRDRAERLLLDRVGHEMLRNTAWKACVYESARQTWDDRRQRQPDEYRDVVRQLAAVEAKIARLLDAIEDGTAGPDVQGRLAARRRERDELVRRKAELDKAAAEQTAEPTQGWVDEQLAKLHGLITGGGPAAAVALRNLIGCVRVEECSPVRGKRAFLRGHFSVGHPATVTAGATGPSEPAAIAIDFRDEPPWAAVADRVKELIDSGILYAGVAARLGCPESWPAKALAYWHERRGLPAPDGRAGRDRLPSSPEALQLRERAKAMWDEGLLMREIAAAMGCCKDTVTALIRGWHEDRGLTVPDGRGRRKTLPRQRLSG